MVDDRSPPSANAVLDAHLVSRLKGVSARLRRFLLLDGAAVVLGFLLVACLVQLSLDYGLRGLRWSMRLALLLVIAALALRLLWTRVLAPLRLKITPTDVAHLIERRFPHFSSLLVSAVRFAAGEVGSAASNSPALAASAMSRVTDAARDAEFQSVLDGRRSVRAAALVSAGLAACLLGATLRPDVARLWFARNVLLQEVEWPRRTQLVVEAKDGVLFGARGDDVVIHAFAEGVQPREVDIRFTTASGDAGRETMVTVGNPGAYRYRYTFKNAQENLTFSLRGGDDETTLYSLHLLERPRVVESRVTLTAPAYARIPEVTLGDGQRSAQVLSGTQAVIWLRTNKPVVSAKLLAGDQLVAEAVPDGAGYRLAMSLNQTQTLSAALVDDAGLEDRQPTRFSFRVVKDDPPSARLKLPGVGEMVTPEAIIPFALEFSDAYGLAAAELLVEVSREGFGERSIDLADFAPHATTYATSVSWPVAAEGVLPGERLAFRARASDFDDVSGPNVAQSPAITLRVVTRDELLAELARREQESRMDFERLVDAQEQLRGALLSLLDEFQRGVTAPDSLAAALAALERRQRSLTGSVHVISQQFERILGELRVNQLDTTDERERLSGGIIEPLTKLTKRDMPRAADTLRQWSRDAGAETAALIDPQQAQIVQEMRAVLATMLQWEGYHEVVTLLRDIVRLQSELNTETRQAAEQEADDVFDE